MVSRTSIGFLQQTITWYKIRLLEGKLITIVNGLNPGVSVVITIPELGQYNKGHDWLRSLCFNVSVRDGMVLQWNGVIRITLS